MARRLIMLVAAATVLEVVTGALIALFITGPVSLPDAVTTPTWRLESLSLDGAQQPLITDHPITLRFHAADRTVTGSSACNSYAAAYTTTRLEGFHLYGGKTTLMACTPASVMTLESIYLDALTRVATYHLVGQTLTLRDGNSTVELRFVLSGT